MTDITPDELFKHVEACAANRSLRTSLRDTEPYLFEPVSAESGEIPDNDDLLIESLSNDDLDISLDVA